MSSTLQTIAIESLVTVTGGAGEQLSGNIGVSVPTKGGPVQVGVQGSQSRSDYAKCADVVSNMQGSTPRDVRETCGLPPSGG